MHNGVCGFLDHLFFKIREVGIGNLIKGAFKHRYYILLQKKYDFDPWHCRPYEWRGYCQAIVKYVNDLHPDCVVDVGYGLGEVLSRIKAPTRIGYDYGTGCAEVAAFLNRKIGGVDYRGGSFDEVGPGMEIDALISTGFMHGSTEDIWNSAYHRCAERNNIKRFIVDVIPSREGVHCLDFSLILPETYTRRERLGPFSGDRYIEVWQKTDI